MAAPSNADLTAPLVGLPTKVTIPGHGSIQVGPHPVARQAAYDYTAEAGIAYNPPADYAKVDTARATKIAQAYDEMKHDPSDPEVKAAYDAMISETVAQLKAIEATGLDIDWIDIKKGDPYAASPRLATEDVRDNNHLWVFPTNTGFGSDEAFDASDNPLLADSGIVIKGHKLTNNDVFRIVHDYFGHIKEGNGFRADGEENAWRSHSAMYTPLARRAMTTETRGQNSWVNYGPYGETNRTASAGKTHFADQKVGLLPEWVAIEGSGALGSGPEQRAAKYESLLQSKEAQHPGRSYTDRAVVDANGVIHSDDVTDIARALYEGRMVNMVSHEMVATSIEYLGEVSSRMAKTKGAQKTVFDLCKATVEGTNLFCVESKGVPRVQMPQLEGIPKPGSKADKLPKNHRGAVDLGPAFREHLEKQGFKIEDTTVPADHLKATQNQLNGENVASLANKIRGKGPRPFTDDPIFVSDDNYVVDGHHRWAAKVAVDFDDGTLGDSQMPVARINMPITDLLKVANDFATEMGIPQASVTATLGAEKKIPKGIKVSEEAKRGGHNYPKPKLKGVQKASHPAKISPSVTSTEAREIDSDVDYIPTGLEQMRKAEGEPPAPLKKGQKHEPGDKGKFTANMELMQNETWYPGMRPEDLEGRPEQIARNAIKAFKQNLRYLVGKASEAQKGGVAWYRGARKLVDAKVKQYGLNDAAVAGVFAALSPQKDWDQNIYLAHAVIDIYMNHQDTAWDDNMQSFADDVIAREEKKMAKQVKAGKKATSTMVPLLAAIKGKKLSELDDVAEKGMWIRVYEEAYGDPSQPLVDGSTTEHQHGFKFYNPDGTFGDYHTNKPDKKTGIARTSKASWNTTDAVAGAIMALESNGDRTPISEAMGEVHKVRNFYNNILDPDSADGDVTMDTHAIGAAWMQPYSGGAPAVAHGLSTNPSARPAGWKAAKDSNRHGAMGMYGLYADAYRELANELGMLPVQLQSVAWVVKRDLFGAVSKADKAMIDGHWQDYRSGKATLKQTQDRVWAVGEGANARGADADDDEE